MRNAPYVHPGLDLILELCQTFPIGLPPYNSSFRFFEINPSFLELRIYEILLISFIVDISNSDSCKYPLKSILLEEIFDPDNMVLYFNHF